MSYFLSTTNNNEQPQQVEGQRTPSTHALSADDAGYVGGYFKPLGFSKSDDHTQSFYYFSKLCNSIISLKAAKMTKQNLFTLAPYAFWESVFERPKGGVDWVKASNFLVQAGNSKGYFTPDMIRGRGAWLDSDRVVIHAGTHLIIDGEDVSLGEEGNQYVYELAQPLSVEIHNPLTTTESKILPDTLSKLNWLNPLDGHLLAGWLAIAPLCGILPWRPHIWVTGGTGGGKSWVFRNICMPLIGEFGLKVQADSTAAGIRQKIKLDAINLMFEEAEGETEQARMRMENVLSLMRAASAKDGAPILKGSSGGLAQQYMIRSCFAFFSIVPQVQLGSDLRRTTIMEIANLKDRKKFKEIQTTTDEVLTEEYGRRLQARMILNMKALLKSIKIFSEAVARYSKSSALGDQLGGMLAGWWHLENDQPITHEEAEDFCRAFVDDNNTKQAAHEDTDEMKCLQHIVSAQINFQGSNAFGLYSIGELIEACYSKGSVPILRADADKALKRLGLKVALHKHEEYLYVMNGSEWIQSRLSKTAWKSSYKTVLRRLPGAKAGGVTRFSSGLQGRATIIPLKLFLDE